MKQRVETDQMAKKSVIEKLNNAQDGIIIFLIIILQLRLRLNIK